METKRRGRDDEDSSTEDVSLKNSFRNSSQLPNYREENLKKGRFEFSIAYDRYKYISSSALLYQESFPVCGRRDGPVTKRDNSINMKEIRARYYEFSGGSNVGIPGRASPSNSPRGCGYRTPEEIHRQHIHSHLCGRVCLRTLSRSCPRASSPLHPCM